jgi:hypothetical protein
MSDVTFEPLTVDPSIEVDTALGPTEIRVCPGCGMLEPRWTDNDGAGYAAEDDHTYCCYGCAEETGCTCV